MLLPSQSIDLIFQHCGDYIDPEYKPNTRAKYYLSLQFPHVHGGIIIGVFAVRAETTFLGFISGSFQETEDTYKMHYPISSWDSSIYVV